MALKRSYSNESDIPTELKEQYVQKGDIWELQVEGFESVNGVLTKNQELIGKQKTDKADVDRLTGEVARLNGEVGKLSGDLSKAQSERVPTGYVAIKKSEADLIKQLTDQGLKPDEVKAKLDAAEAAAKENADFKLEKDIAEFAKAAGIENVEALSGLIRQAGITPKVTEVDENGAKAKKAFLVHKDGDKDVETPYADYKAKYWGAFAPALDLKGNPKPGNAGDPPPSGGNGSVFDRIREDVKKSSDVKAPDIDARFGKVAA